MNRTHLPSKLWCFTICNPMPDDYKIFIASKDILRYAFQLEVGQLGTPHLQGFCEFNKQCIPSYVIGINRFHWEKCKNVSAAVKYCTKQPGRLAGPWLKNIVLDHDLVKITKYDLYPWQNEILDIISKPPDDRIIHWYWEADGNTGKSTFAKYLVVHHEAVVLSNKSSDMKNAIAEMRLFPKLIIIDCPRSAMGHISYPAVEEIKNGLFFSGKYKSAMVCGASPHIFIFSNAEPEYDKLSADRWRVVNIPQPPEKLVYNPTADLERDDLAEPDDTEIVKELFSKNPGVYGEDDEGADGIVIFPGKKVGPCSDPKAKAKNPKKAVAKPKSKPKPPKK